MAQAQRIGAPRAIALCQAFKGTLDLQAGHWSEAEAALRKAIELFRQIGAASGEALSCQKLGLLQTAQGKLDEALDTLEDGVVASKQASMRSHLLGRLHSSIARNRLLAGDLAAADYALSLGLSEDHGRCTICESLTLPVGVSLRIAQGDLAAAETYCRQLDEAAEHYGSRTWLAMALQARGELAAARGDLETALAHYEEACTGFETARNEYEAALCREALDQLRQRLSSPKMVRAG